jgi:acylphosphatase
MSEIDGSSGGDVAARLTSRVSGDVQGVGFRMWARARGQELGVSGYATNLSDGRVEVVAEGSKAACTRLLDALRGPDAPGSVSEVSADWASAQGEFSGFSER